MKIRIEETGEIKTLTLIDPSEGNEYAEDFLKTIKCLPTYDKNGGVYLSKKEDYEAWVQILKLYQDVTFRSFHLGMRLTSNPDNLIQCSMFILGLSVGLNYLEKTSDIVECITFMTKLCDIFDSDKKDEEK